MASDPEDIRPTERRLGGRTRGPQYGLSCSYSMWNTFSSCALMYMSSFSIMQVLDTKPLEGCKAEKRHCQCDQSQRQLPRYPVCILYLIVEELGK